jgi:co-chaperonin GroES (HSP10)
MKPSYAPHRIRRLRALHDWVLVEDMNFDERITTGGIVLMSDNGKGTGIRPRWGRIYATGPVQALVRPGQWILVAHGRWTRGIEIEDDTGVHTIRRVDADDILLMSDEQPSDETMSDAIHIEAKSG